MVSQANTQNKMEVKEHQKVCLKMASEVVCIFLGHLGLWKDVSDAPEFCPQYVVQSTSIQGYNLPSRCFKIEEIGPKGEGVPSPRSLLGQSPAWSWGNDTPKILDSITL